MTFSYRRFGLGSLVLSGLASLAAFAACAEGGTAGTEPDGLVVDAGVDAGNLQSDDDSGTLLPPGPCNNACKPIEVCVNEVCVIPDDDKDGYGKDVDCDDSDAKVHPGATESCNGKDDDCNGKVDDGLDKDDDGFAVCAPGGDGGSAVDCDDSDKNIHPGATEICNGKDDDCNGKIDELPASLNGPLAPLDAHWKLFGSATIEDGWAKLTPDLASKAGSLFWNAEYTFDTFEMNATFKVVKTNANSADGLAFGWVSGAPKLPNTSAGSGFALKGLSGYAVVLDMYKNNDESWDIPAVAVHSTSKMSRLSKAVSVAGLNDGNDHTLRVALNGGKVTVAVDGTVRIDAFAIPGYVAPTGSFGFGAATGDFSEAHHVKDVRMSFPEGQGCVQ